MEGAEAVQVEEQLRESEQLYRSLLESITDYAIFKLDAEGFIRSWSPGAAEMTGYTTEEIIGRHLTSLYSADDIAHGQPMDGLRLAAALGKFADEGWRIRKDGSRFWGCVLVTPLRNSSGKLIGFSRVLRDETERRITEQKLRQSEDRFRSLVESMPGLVFATDATGRTTFVKPAVSGLHRPRPRGSHRLALARTGSIPRTASRWLRNRPPAAGTLAPTSASSGFVKRTRTGAGSWDAPCPCATPPATSSNGSALRSMSTTANGPISESKH